MVSAMAQQQATKTIFELLGMEPDVFSLSTHPQTTAEEHMDEDDIEALSAAHDETVQHLEAQTAAPAALPVTAPVAAPEEEIDLSEFSTPDHSFWAKNYVRYPLIFLLALSFFYVVLNFGAIFAQVKNYFVSSGQEQEKVVETAAPDYTRWVKKYYLYLSDQQLLEPKNDADFDGLVNAEEFYLGTNPLKWDTDSDGFSDGQDVVNGYNPLYVGRLTGGQETLVAEYVNLDGVRSRLALREFQQVAGEQSITVGREFAIDLEKPGQLSIPKLGVQAPIVWTRDFARMEEDLKSGATHHPATPYPGERGTVSIHGHSSGNPWDGNYKTVFTKLNFLEPGDEVLVTVYNAASEGKQYRYVVREKQVFAKGDQEQFDQRDGYFLNLSTSWPVGTALQRYVVTTELVGL